MPLLARCTDKTRTSRALTIFVDGAPVTAAEGDTVLTAMLLAGDRLRDFEFGGEPRAGFCLMGACQDCYVWTSDGAHLRTCTTPVTEGMRVMTAFPMPRPVVSP